MTPRLREGLFVFLFLALTFGQFFQASTWGAACRFDLARALVEQRTITIDAYHRNTGDKAILDGTYYSDKAPLPSFLATPGVALSHGLRAVFGGPTSESVWLAMTGGLAAFFASGLITALGGVVFFLALRDRGFGFAVAWLATAFVFLGTTLFPYATVMQGHAPAAAWMFVFFHLAFPVGSEPGVRREILAGVAASAAVATEYLTGPPLVILGVMSIVRHRDVALRHGVAMFAGALPGGILLGLYHMAAFGGPFELGYQHVALLVFQEQMSKGLFGIGLPDPIVAGELLFGPFRGLAFASPLLLLALPGFVSMWRRELLRWDAAAAAVVFLFYLLVNAGYSTWDGGWAIGPRHLVATIPFLGLGVAASLVRWPRLTCGLAAVSGFFMLAATAVQPEVPDKFANPLFDHLLPHFVRGELTVGEQGFGDSYPHRLDPSVPDRWDAFLLGDVLRLPGPLALLPIFLVWGAATLWVVRREDA